jgi:hypothetical protein
MTLVSLSDTKVMNTTRPANGWAASRPGYTCTNSIPASRQKTFQSAA